MGRENVLAYLHCVIQKNGHILLAASGNGMSAKYAIAGGADLILTISAGRFRQMGNSAFSAFFGCVDTNQMVMDYATREVLPLAGSTPVVCGVFMQDPCIHLYEYYQDVIRHDFTGIINYPSIGLFNRKFRNALEGSGLGYEKEVEGIRLAHFMGLLTVAYVFDAKQAVEMAKAGADIICVHFGITGGGILGANQVISLEHSMEYAENIFRQVDRVRPDIIKVVSGGPVQSPTDGQIFYSKTSCQGFLGGSPLERLPVEKAMLKTVRAFKEKQDNEVQDSTVGSPSPSSGENPGTDYVSFVTDYIHNNYHQCIRLKNLARAAHLSTTRLSMLFKERTGSSFTDYLIRHRIKQACTLLKDTDLQLKEVAIQVGYEDYSQFTKMFKKVMGCAPRDYRRHPACPACIKEEEEKK